MKRIIKSGVKKLVSLIFHSFGYKGYLGGVFLNEDSPEDMLLVDRNVWSPFYQGNERVDLYYEGLKRAEVEWSDNLHKQCRFYSLQQMVEMAVKKGGDFVECGCWKGHSTFIISKILAKNEFNGKFHVFDSFEGGLSGKTVEDKNERFELSDRQLKIENAVFKSTEDEVYRSLSGFDFPRLYKGWIPTRFHEVEDRKFSFLHVDVDLYQPTLDSLHFFYSRLLSGGIVVVDDYGLTQFAGCKKAVDEFLSANDYSFFYEVPLGGCFIIK